MKAALPVNCRTAHAQLAAAADVPPDAAAAAALQAHLDSCPHCRHLPAQLAAATAAWRETAARVSVPDARAEWHAVRRILRQAGPAADRGRSPLTLTWARALRWAAPFTAVAAIALLVRTGLPPSPEPSATVLAATTNPVTPSAKLAAAEAPASGSTDDPWREFENHFAFVAHAEYVETDNEDASPFVYVDDESGWLIVWASAPPDAASS